MKKIMVVDDNPDHLHSIKQTIENMDDDYRVTCASSGIRCLKLLENNEIPDLILLDIMMPKMSGWEIFYRLKENQLWKNIPVVFCTARSDQMANDTGSFLGDDYIEKPFDIEDLEKRIEKLEKK
ncbi:MAG: response regulator [Thermoplasmatales archaeon]|nr:response regulator [Thermoplasmatales archaeon]